MLASAVFIASSPHAYPGAFLYPSYPRNTTLQATTLLTSRTSGQQRGLLGTMPAFNITKLKDDKGLTDMDYMCGGRKLRHAIRSLPLSEQFRVYWKTIDSILGSAQSRESKDRSGEDMMDVEKFTFGVDFYPTSALSYQQPSQLGHQPRQTSPDARKRIARHRRLFIYRLSRLGVTVCRALSTGLDSLSSLAALLS